MSLGYAERLSYRDDLGGRLGAPEKPDGAAAALAAAEKLALLVKSASRVVAFTGAGISTSTGIPDFRSPGGVWTLQRAGAPLPKLSTSFAHARPSLTHMALVALLRTGKLTYVCSQNVDGLHLRSGVPRAQLAELHGNCFAERCRKCGAEVSRDFEVESVGFKATGRTCGAPGCGGPLHDTVLDWEDALPDAELDEAERQAGAADVALALGTSLQIVPAAEVPLRTVERGGAFAVVNLQPTPMDRHAAAVIRARVDHVMALVLDRLGLAPPPYERADAVLARVRLLPGGAAAVGAAAAEGGSGGKGGGGEGWGFELRLESAHGRACPLPMVESAAVTFAAQPKGSGGGGGGGDLLEPAALAGAAPLAVTRRVAGSADAVVATVRLQLAAAADADKRSPEFEIVIARNVKHGEFEHTLSFISQRQDYAERQRELVAEFEAAAAAETRAAGAGADAAAASAQWRAAQRQQLQQQRGGGGARRGRGGGGSGSGRQRAAARYDEVSSDDDDDGSDGDGDDGGGGGGGGSGSGAPTSRSGRVRKRTKRLNM